MGSNSLVYITEVKGNLKFEEIYNKCEGDNSDLFEECKEKSMNFNTVKK